MDLPDVEFSESEFEQAGLLYDKSSGLTAPPLATIAKTSGPQPHDVNSIRQPEPASLLSQASALPNPSEPWHVPVRNLTENRATEQQATHTRPEQAADASSKKAANREHQRKFRLRQKERTEAVQAQLDRTTAQLQEMKMQKLELEQQLQRRPQASSVLSAISKSQQGAARTDSAYADLSTLPPLTVSISGDEQQLTIKEFVDIPIKQFTELWAEYMSELTRCLAQLDNKMDSLIETRLYQLTFEAFMLREESFRMKACDNNTKAMLFCRWQQGDIGPEDVYDQLLNVLKLSVEQIRDLMFVRRIDYIKHHLLDSPREAIAAQIKEHTPNPIANVNKLSALATQLQHQAVEDHDLVHRVSWAVHCGILSMKQAARWLVIIGREHNALLDYIAKHNDFPTEEQMITTIDEATFSHEWDRFSQYTDTVNPYISKHPGHVPVFKPWKSADAMQVSLY